MRLTLLLLSLRVAWFSMILAFVAVKLGLLGRTVAEWTDYHSGRASVRAGLSATKVPVRSTSKSVNWRVSTKTAFTGAYVVGSLFNASVAAAVFLFAAPLLSKGSGMSMSCLLYLVLMQIQLARRLFECLTVHSFSGRSTSLPALVFAWSFYPLVTAAFVVEILVLDLSDASLPAEFHWYSGLVPVQLLAIFLFCGGSYVQNSAHRTLAALRAGGSAVKSPARPLHSHLYRIPRGRFFSLVACPHYAAEILIYCAFVLASNAVLSSWLVLLFVILNLGTSARSTHQWYMSRFRGQYPQQRRVLVPYLW